MRTLERLFRRVCLPLAMSQGFHPKPKISSPSALALGIDGEDEVLDLEMLETADPVDTVSLLERLNRSSLAGLVFHRAELLVPGRLKARMRSARYEMIVPEGDRDGLKARIDDLLIGASFIVSKHNGKTVDVRPAVVLLEFDEKTGRLVTEILANKQAHNGPEVGIRELLTAIGLEERLFKSVFPVRTRVFLLED